MVDLAMSIFEFLNKFLIFWHPWHPWVCVRSGLKQIWGIPPTVLLYDSVWVIILTQTTVYSQQLLLDETRQGDPRINGGDSLIAQ